MRRRALVVVAVALTLTSVTVSSMAPAALTTPAYADHGGGPSASDVAAGKARVARLEQQVAAAAADVARSRDALDRLRTQAEVAIESYDRSRVQEAAAQQSLSAARLVLAAAGARVSAARADVGRFAAAAYEGGALSTVDVLLTSQGPDTMLYRLGEIGAVSRSQRAALQQLSAAQVYEDAVQQQAAAVLAEAQHATAAAAAARDHAQHMVAVQTAGVARLASAQQRLTTMLTDARAHASALERARLQALARARAAAAARQRAAALRAAQEQARQQAAQQQASGSSGQEIGATVSAETEQGALRAAESQLGKPYEWGAAGPDTYDCSGLVMWAYAQVGVHVDHWTGYQWNEGAHISLSDLRAGDLLFFASDTSNPDTIHHVGIYVGNGQMIEAPYTGANVRYNDAFRSDLIGAVRLFDR